MPFHEAGVFLPTLCGTGIYYVYRREVITRYKAFWEAFWPVHNISALRLLLNGICVWAFDSRCG